MSEGAADGPDDDAVTVATAPADVGAEVPWQRLDAKMIVVDAVQILLSLTPTAIAVLVVGVEAGRGTLAPAIGLAIFGCVGAVGDATRWITTRYRITEDYVERRTGLFVRQYRSIRLDRIRSIDSTAKLRHRIAKLRPLEIGAGQHSATGEAALVLDAVSTDTARGLRRELLEARRAADPGGPSTSAAVVITGDDVPGAGPAVVDGTETVSVEGAEKIPTGDPTEAAIPERTIARIDWAWLPYNVVGVWAFLMAGGIIWGGNWLVSTLGIDVIGTIADGLADTSLGPLWLVVIVVAAAAAIGAVGLGAHFVVANWDLRLARVRGADGTVLRTTRGLLTTREVDRDDRRLRGVTISEPLLWRWVKMADTTVITTGLSAWGEAATVIPRGPRHVADRVAADVLELDPADSPFAASPTGHPRAALRRRVSWATATAVVASVVLWGAAGFGRPTALMGVSIGALWIVAILLAAASYRALGHTISGDYVVTRSGLASWGTNALRRRAVSGVAIRQSLLQRRLGLASVTVMTAAGWGQYRAPDLASGDAAAFADDASLGLLANYLEDAPGESGG